MLTIFAVYVEDKPGVLNRVASLFRRRAFNIESLTVGQTEKPGVSRMTIVVDTDEAGAARLEANLYKLISVQRVENITAEPSVSRDLAMIKVASNQESRVELMQLVGVFRARVVDVAPDSLIIETTGTEDKINGLVDVLRPYGIIEMVRTGRVAMARGSVNRVAGQDKPHICQNQADAGQQAPALAFAAAAGEFDGQREPDPSLKGALERALAEHQRESGLHMIGGRQKLIERLVRAMQPEAGAEEERWEQ